MPKMPKMPHNLPAQFVSPSPKVLDFNEKRLHWVAVVRAQKHHPSRYLNSRDLNFSVLNQEGKGDRRGIKTIWRMAFKSRAVGRSEKLGGYQS